MTDFEGQVLADLHVLKNQMDQLMGVGQPGRLHHIEARVAATEQGVQRVKGGVGVFGMVLTLLHLAVTYLGGRHH
ncbi:hypothetical protein FTO74_00090 [Granulicella sp. WH15]|uniref:hypothetical protein n=1 Tax=Granulicella sp. WH15 TaxID=2602070 RepID=UPI001366EA85|nr:hypothetical protein [Granulicella sp. WH15]QHN01954.1 hypothetical protein FTO74_00090 [Granulicella sp. WH15]